MDSNWHLFFVYLGSECSYWASGFWYDKLQHEPGMDGCYRSHGLHCELQRVAGWNFHRNTDYKL